VGNVCGQCHATIAEQYESSRHSQTFASLGMPGCATCHRNHEIVAAADSLLGLDDGAICANCHSEGDRGGAAAGAMRAELDSLSTGIEQATEILHEAEQAGMEVSAAQADLSTARSALVMGRTVVHSFSPEAVSEAVAPGLEVASAGYLRGIEALDDLRIRRLGLVISVVIILVLVAGLALKIRQIEA
jgi:predicted CXXCH cytochrome family protein